MRLYIAGPMTGLPEYNRPAFNEAQARLEAAGYDVLNPARHPDGLSYDQYMVYGFEDVKAADGVALLPGWHESPGALREVSYADELGTDADELGIWLMISLTRSDPKYPSLNLPRELDTDTVPSRSSQALPSAAKRSASRG